MVSTALMIKTILQEKGERAPEEFDIKEFWIDWGWYYQLGNYPINRWESCDGIISNTVHDENSEKIRLLYHDDSYDGSPTIIKTDIKGDWETILKQEYDRIIKDPNTISNFLEKILGYKLDVIPLTEIDKLKSEYLIPSPQASPLTHQD